MEFLCIKKKWLVSGILFSVFVAFLFREALATRFVISCILFLISKSFTLRAIAGAKRNYRFLIFNFFNFYAIIGISKK